MSEQQKVCKKCGETKLLGEFYAMKEMKDGHRSDCKGCNLAAKKARYEADPQKYIGFVKRWQRANPEKVLAYQRAYRADPAKQRIGRDGHLRRKFGITADQYDEMLEAQGGGCAICGRTPRPDISLHVDHEHESGRVRGLLCFPCNQALGAMAEDPDRCRGAASYLESHRSRGA